MKLSSLVVLILGLFLANAARAAECVDLAKMSFPDAVITACTVEIQRGVGRVDVAYAYTVRSHAFLLKGDQDRALADLNQALAVSPYFSGALIDRAVLYTKQGRLDLALKDYNDAVLSHPRVPEMYVYRGVHYLDQGDVDHALADANSALAIKGKSALALNFRCWVRATAGLELSSAMADCNEALALSPGLAGYLDSRGLVDLRLGEFDGAIRDYNAALSRSPGMPTSLFGRSLAKRRKGDTAGADADAASAASMDKSVAAKFAGWGLKP